MITQGKWEINEYGILNADGMELGKVYFNDVDEDSLAESEANARLIAAAPELLDACKAIIEAKDEYPLQDPRELCNAIDFEQIRDAIAKAEGK